MMGDGIFLKLLYKTATFSLGLKHLSVDKWLPLIVSIHGHTSEKSELKKKTKPQNKILCISGIIFEYYLSVLTQLNKSMDVN